MKILGIDPGTAITGWSVVDFQDKPNILSYGVIRTDSKEFMPKRLEELYDDLRDVLFELKPEILAIEDLFFFKNAKTVITVGQARGVAILAAQKAGLDIFEYTPLQIKQSLTGYGRADKKQMQSMVKSVYGLKEIPRPDDAADALAVAYTHYIYVKNRLKQ